MAENTSPQLARDLLAWYDANRRVLPWRAAPGERPDPYRVWLSEIMLQQTTAGRVGGYFNRFTARWPTLAALARAPEEEVLAEWAGLGYYARARNLHACARTVVEQHEGRFPDTEDALLALPGIGRYTAAAIAAIAYGLPATPVDGNVERVISRLRNIREPLPRSRPLIRRHAAALTPRRRSGDYAQAVMDLGATVCTPRSPACADCPWHGSCAARAAGNPAELPRRIPRPARPTRYGTAFWCLDGEGGVLLRRRPASGLLGGMVEVPTSDWTTVPGPAADPPLPGHWQELAGTVRHTFTHFHLELRVRTARLAGRPLAPGRCFWHPVAMLDAAGLPSVMRKVAQLATRA